jgi:GxxExxY protein
MEHGSLTYRIRGCIFEVYRQLGHGFLEKVYEKALMHELALQNIQAVNQQSLQVCYKGEDVGDFIADIIVENKVVVELKAQKQLPAHSESQLINYLRAGGYKIG